MKYEENKHQVVKPVVHKYSEQMVEEMVAMYLAEDDQEGRDAVVEEMTIKFDKPKKSIIAKLSKIKINGKSIYIKKQSVSKLTGVKPETKEQLVRRIAMKHNRRDEEMYGLEKAPKKVLLILLGEK